MKFILRIIIIFLTMFFYNKIVYFIVSNLDYTVWTRENRAFYIVFKLIVIFVAWRLTYDSDLWDSSNWFDETSKLFRKTLKNIITFFEFILKIKRK